MDDNAQEEEKRVVFGVTQLGSFRCRDSNPGRSGESRVS